MLGVGVLFEVGVRPIGNPRLGVSQSIRLWIFPSVLVSCLTQVGTC